MVNCTSQGLKPDDAMPFEPARVDAGAAVVDIIMSRQPTPVLRACRAAVAVDPRLAGAVPSTKGTLTT